MLKNTCVKCNQDFLHETSNELCPDCQLTPIEVEVKKMGSKYSGTQTEVNLIKAFIAECQARAKYTYFAGKASEDGYEKIAENFLQTADNEKAHAKIWFDELGLLGNTESNLVASVEGENYEWTDMYSEFARQAEVDGFNALAYKFREVAKIETGHQTEFQKYLDEIKQNTVFMKDSKVEWECKNCGHIVNDIKAPEVCSVCNHPQAYFEHKTY